MSIAVENPTLADGIAGLTAALAANPEAAQYTPSVRTQLEPGTATKVTIQASGHDFVIDEPETLGGTNLGANPVEHLLAALAACQVISYQVWAAKLGITVDSIEVDAQGDIDLRGFFGVDDAVPAGFQAINTTVRISGPEDAATYTALAETVESHCPVGDTLARTVPAHTQVVINK